MRKAAEARDFERAASLRDTLYDLRQTVHQSARKFVRDLPRRMDPVGELADLAKEFGLPGPPRVIEGFDVAHIHGQFAVGSMVQFVGGRPSRANYRHFKIRGDALEGEALSPKEDPLVPAEFARYALNDDCASMREIVGRRYRRLRAEGRPLPDLVLVDGGRGQLNAALEAVTDAGVQLRMAGLAKEEEAIYLPDRPEPLKLGSGSPALRLLQRIRDESHRFANTFHESWRRKQIRASALDELPGMGGQRKQTLLRRFGSVENLRKATLEQIREVEGFGDKSAEILWRHLHPDVDSGAEQ